MSAVAAAFAGIVASRAATPLPQNPWFIACVVVACLAFAILLLAGPALLLSWWRLRQPQPLDLVEAKQRALDAGERARGLKKSLPLVREVKDRALLGIHPAIPLPGDEPALSQEFPLYVSRDVDADLDGWISNHRVSGGFLLLVGPAAAGKTRTAYELVHRALGDWRMFMPTTAAELIQYVESSEDIDGLVVWLNEIQDFLGSEGLTSAAVRRMLSDARPVILIGTIWPDRYEALTEPSQSSEDTVPNPDARSILGMLADRKDLLSTFTTGEYQKARTLAARDPRIAEALRDNDRFNLPEILAAAPALISRWLTAASPCGRAVITAAVVARRCGHPEPLPTAVLEPLAETFLSPAERARAEVPWFQPALDWARKPVRGQVAALTPQATKPGVINGDVISDVLVQYAERNPSAPGHTISESTWFLLIDAASPEACKRIGDEAFVARQLDDSDIGERALRKAATAGLPSAMANLGLLLRARRKYAESEQWQRKAANAGIVLSMCNLGNLLAWLERADEAEQWYRKAAEAGFLPGMAGLGALLYKRGEPAKAEEWYRKAAAAEYPDAMFRLGLMLNERGEVAEAEKWWRKAADAGLAEAVLALGNQLINRGEPGKAEECWRKAAEAGQPEAMFHLAVLMDDQGQHNDAEEWYRKAAEAGQPEAMSNLGIRLDRQGLEAEAERWYRQAAEAGIAPAMINLGILLDRHGQPEEAEGWQRKAAETGHANAMLNLAKKLADKDRPEEAQEWLRKAADSGNSEAMFGLGSLSIEQDNILQAADWWRKAADAGHIAAMFNLGLFHADQDQPDEAEEWWRKAADAGHVPAMINLGLALSKRGKSEDAEKWWRKAAQTGNVPAMSQLAYACAKQARHEEAEVWYLKAAEAGDPSAIRNLAVLLEEQGEIIEAEKWHRKAVADGDPIAMSNFGAFLDEQGKDAEAEKWYRRAAEAGAVPAMVNLAMMLVEQGKHDVAKEWWNKARTQSERGPTDSE